jgi:hypothetical protein
MVQNSRWNLAKMVCFGASNKFRCLIRSKIQVWLERIAFIFSKTARWIVPPLSSAGQNRVNEFILRFTHTLRMDWFAPGIDATGRRLVVPHVGIISFENGKISSEHIYWDQATVLMQMGLLNKSLPVIGDTQCDRLLDANAPVNQLINRGAPDA